MLTARREGGRLAFGGLLPPVLAEQFGAKVSVPGGIRTVTDRLIAALTQSTALFPNMPVQRIDGW